MLNMDSLFHFPDAVRRDAGVDAWLERQPAVLGRLARRWFDLMRACGEDVRELLHDGHQTACAGDSAFAYVSAFTSHVNVGFFQGAELPDPAGLLQGSGRAMRHVTLRPGEPVDAKALHRLIVAAHADMRRRSKTG